MGGDTVNIDDTDAIAANITRKNKTDHNTTNNNNRTHKSVNHKNKKQLHENDISNDENSSSTSNTNSFCSAKNDLLNDHESKDIATEENGTGTNKLLDIKPKFNLRVVPLEKLLAKPPQEVNKTPENITQRRALERKSKSNNISIIELSDSEDNEEQDEPGQIDSSSTSSIKIIKLATKLNSCSKRAKRSLGAASSANTSSINITKTATEEPLKGLCSSSDKNAGLLISTCTNNEANKKTTNQPTVIAAVAKRTDFRIKRCIVRLKRTHLSDCNNTAAKTQANGKKNTEKMADTRRGNLIQNSDDDDSDECAIVQPAYDSNTDAEENEEEEEDDVAEKEDDTPNSSDSEVLPTRKRRVFNNSKKNNSSNNDDDSDFEPSSKQKSKKRKRIKKASSDDDDDEDGEKAKNKRKHIRKIISTKDLDVSTKTAARQEDDRRKRIEERQKLYNQIFEKPDNIEITELVLDFDEGTKKPLLQVDKGLLKKLKPHQVAGVKFMWDACFETLKDVDQKPGSGCILAHCMGLGKTLQIVTLSHTLLTHSNLSNVERVLIISPLSTLNNWAREFVQWMKFARQRNIEIYDISRFKDKPTRIFKLNEWFEEGGVCILGYDMYRILANDKAKGLRKKQREQLQKALVDPGPDLVVCDEGHLLKNEKTSISKAVTQMRTRRRIVLTGTPLQNNLKEYYCMIQFIKPNLLGTYKEYLNRFVNPITNGQYTDSTERDIRLMKHRSHILHNMLQGCIQRRDYSVLAPYLPPKHEYVVYTTLTDLQQELYEFYMTIQRDLSSSDIGGKGARLFQDFQDLRRIWTHPMNLRVNSDNVIAKRLLTNDESDLEDFICDDEEESDDASNNSSNTDATFNSDASNGGGGSGGGGVKKMKKHKTRNETRNGGNNDDSDVVEINAIQKDDPSEWWKRFVEDKELNNINHSPKLVILMRLLQQCEAIGDKLLVFSQSLQSLDVIEHFLSLINSSTKGIEIEGDISNFKGCWNPGEDYFRLDGSCSVEQREAMCKKFNNTDNLRARLFLISTRAGGLGINLVAANRVVIFDVSWNPSHDTQSIFRVYRFGQNKPCYIYRLIAMGTMEQKVYERQVAKQATAKRVIDEQQISRHYNQSDLQELYTYELKPSVEREVPILPKDLLFAELLSDHEALIFKYHEHDSLLENEDSENLSESERKAAWAEYEAEKTRSVQTHQYVSYDRGAFGGIVAAQFGNSSGPVTTSKIFGFRSDILLQLLNMKISKDHPELTHNQVVQLTPAYLQQLYTEMNNGDPTMYKELLQLHTTLARPSGMYMSPLLYANQDPQAAGYFQASTAGGAQPSGLVGAPIGALSAQGTMAAPLTAKPEGPGFDPNMVYEIID